MLDLGSGGGVPSLPLLLGWPDTRGALIEARPGRCRFLEAALEPLGLADRTDVYCGRAETLARSPELRHRFDLVVARSFASPAVTAECAVGFLAPGGLLVVAEPPRPDADRWPAPPLARLGLAFEESVRSGGFTFARLRRADEVPDRWPRRAPAKRALW